MLALRTDSEKLLSGYLQDGTLCDGPLQVEYMFTFAIENSR
jgi:hypothetical protein